MNFSKSRPSNCDFVVSRNEPIMKLITALNFKPITLGISFFLLISITLTIAGAFCPSNLEKPDFINYFSNISWSISMLIIFPLVVGLILKYYQEISNLFQELSRHIGEEHQVQYKEFITDLDKIFNYFLIPPILLAITVVLNYLYYVQILNKEPYVNWITNGEILKNILKTNSGFTYPGLYSAFVQMILIYCILNLAWNSFIFALGLYVFFNGKPFFKQKYNFDIKIDPLHIDRCCGLRRIGQVGMIFNYILFLLGIYLSLKVVDKIVIQNLPLTNDIGNPILLACYGLLAPLLFFLPLSAAHNKMKNKKEELLNSHLENFSKIVEKIRTDSSGKLYKEAKHLDELISNLDKKIPVWPFNFKSLESFFGSVIMPILPICLPFIIKGIANLYRETRDFPIFLF